jgi:hypothetical protein
MTNMIQLFLPTTVGPVKGTRTASSISWLYYLTKKTPRDTSKLEGSRKLRGINIARRIEVPESLFLTKSFRKFTAASLAS